MSDKHDKQRKPYWPQDLGSEITISSVRLTEQLQVIDVKIEKMFNRTDFWGERTLTSCGNKLDGIRKEVNELSAKAFNAGLRNHQGLRSLENLLKIVDREYERAIRSRD